MSPQPAITELLLHRGPMLLVEEVLEADVEQVVVSARVDADAWYAEAGGAMPAWVGIELMAQAIAAYSGLQARAQGQSPRIGYLLGTRAYRAKFAHFPAPARLVVSARCAFRDQSGLGAFDCELRHQGEVLAEATLKVFETPRGGA